MVQTNYFYRIPDLQLLRMYSVCQSMYSSHIMYALFTNAHRRLVKENLPPIYRDRVCTLPPETDVQTGRICAPKLQKCYNLHMYNQSCSPYSVIQVPVQVPVLESQVPVPVPVPMSQIQVQVPVLQFQVPVQVPSTTTLCTINSMRIVRPIVENCDAAVVSDL